MLVAGENAGCRRHRALGPALLAVGQAALRVGGVDALDEIEGRADHRAAVRVEHQHLTEVGDHQQLAGRQDPRGQRQADHRLAPPDPLRRGEGQHGAGLPDVEVVEAVEQRAGHAAALPQPAAPALAALVAGLPHHQRAPGRRLGVRGQVAARPEGDLGAEITLHRPAPVQCEIACPRGGRVAAVGRVAVLRRPAVGGVCVDPGVGGSAAGDGQRRHCDGNEPAHGHSWSRHRVPRLAGRFRGQERSDPGMSDALA